MLEFAIVSTVVAVPVAAGWGALKVVKKLHRDGLDAAQVKRKEK